MDWRWHPESFVIFCVAVIMPIPLVIKNWVPEWNLWLSLQYFLGTTIMLLAWGFLFILAASLLATVRRSRR